MALPGDPWSPLKIPPPTTSPEQEAWPGSTPSFAELADLCRKYAVTEENVVTAEVAIVQDLADLLTKQLRKVHALAPDRPGGWQALTCAADVAEGLAAVTRESAPAHPSPPDFMPPAPRLAEIPVIVSEDSAPGTWRLVTHDHCEVKNGDDLARASVSHAGCSITAEGRLG
jgi:hypothetical protein